MTGYRHVEFKPNGTPMIAGTRISVARVALDHTLHDIPAEEIPSHYGGLTLAQVFGALAYYYDHQEEMDRRIVEDEQEVERWRERWAESQAELRARLKARGKLP